MSKTRSQGKPPVVRLTTSARDDIRSLCAAASERGTETHFYLVGARTDREVWITDVVRNGHPVERAATTRPDLGASAQALYPFITAGRVLLGEGHRHHDLLGPSGGDLATLRSIPRDQFPGYLCMVASTRTPDDEPIITVHSITAQETVAAHDVQLAKAEDVPPPARPSGETPYQVLLPPNARKMRILLVGLGSGGCTVALQLSKFGVKALTLVDHDLLEARNLDRHLADQHSIGKNKARWLQRFLKPRTASKLKAVDLEITTETLRKLASLVKKHDLIVNCTGHPVTSNLISAIARAHQRPAIHAGVFRQGSGGFVFAQDPASDTPCYDCLFHLTRNTSTDDNQAIENLTEQYGLKEEELHAQLGLWADITLVAAFQAKIVLETLKRRAGTQPEKNLYLLDNQQISLRAISIAQDPNCTCSAQQPQERSTQ